MSSFYIHIYHITEMGFRSLNASAPMGQKPCRGKGTVYLLDSAERRDQSKLFPLPSQSLPSCRSSPSQGLSTSFPPDCPCCVRPLPFLTSSSSTRLVPLSHHHHPSEEIIPLNGSKVAVFAPHRFFMSSTKRVCLICTRDIQKSSLITHIAEHLNYKRHKCSECSFKSVLMETMVDHQNNTSHKVQFDVKNWYLERVCQLIYSDFEFAQKNGENAIRKFGSVFGDRRRLSEMLKACEVNKEDDEIEVISTHQLENSLTKSNLSAPFIKRSLFENGDQQPEMSSKGSNLVDTQMAHNSITASIQRQNNLHNITLTNIPQSTRSISLQEVEIVHNQSNDKLRDRNSTSLSKLMDIQTVPADSSNELSKSQTTEQLLAELHRQITKGVEWKMCKICHQMVDNDYKSQKEHIIGRHMIGIDQNKRNAKLCWKLEQCFKQEGHLLITNDFQCNICGHETKYKDTRYHHVSALHTDYQWNCVFQSCDFVVRSKKQFNAHLNNWHRMNLNQLEGEAKDRYIMMNSDFEHKLTPLVRKCFPFDLTSPCSVGEEEERKKKKKVVKARQEDALVDGVVSSFMPTAARPTMNRVNQSPAKKTAKKGVKIEYESSSDSDYTDSEHESKPGTTKDSESGREKEGKLERISSLNTPRQQNQNVEKIRSMSHHSSKKKSGNGSSNSTLRNDYRSTNRRRHEHKSSYYYYDNRRSRTKEGYYESPLKRPRHETKKQKIEEQSDSVVYFRR